MLSDNWGAVAERRLSSISQQANKDILLERAWRYHLEDEK